MPRAEFPEKLGYLFAPARYKVAYGGRGGAKSWGFARALLILAARSRLRVLCAREFQNSIQDSVHKLLGEQAEALGLGTFYEVLQSTVRGRNGSEFIFSGLRNNIASIKSKEGIDILWVEEAQTVSKASWDTVIPTIRKDGSEIWVSYNPDLDEDPTHQMFVVNEPPPGSVVVKIGWQDNPWFPSVLRLEMEHAYKTDPEAAAHVWGGQTRRNSDAQVLRGRYVIESFEPTKEFYGPYYGADWGFATDPTTLIRCWIHGRTLYLEHEAYGVGVDLDDTPALFDRVPESRTNTIRADSARPETISHMKRHGYARVIPANKWSGSVEDGVEHLRSYERIVIHPRCTHAAEEARLWSYKVDKLTGDVRPELADKHDHIWDAVRYALEPIIQRGKPLPARPKVAPKVPDYGEREKVVRNWKVS